MSALQIDVGGYIAINHVDHMSYCINVCRIVTSERNWYEFLFVLSQF